LNYKRQTIWLIIISSIVKLVLGGCIELTNDEAYYFTYAGNLQWNYFDHPPMVAVLLKICTIHPILKQAFFIRIPFILLGAGTCWLLFKIGAFIADEFTGMITVCLFIASIYANILAGLLVMPDTPMVFFWVLSAYLMLQLVTKKNRRGRLNNLILMIGGIIGLTILSKAQGIFLWIGFAGWIIFYKTSWLKNPYLYLSMLVSLLLLVPSINWSIAHHFDNINYHQSRLQFSHLQAGSFIRELAGQILYNNPIVVFLIVMGLLKLGVNASLVEKKSMALLKWLSFPLVCTTLLLSLSNDTLPHWSGVAYVILLPVAAVYISKSLQDAHLPGVVKLAMGVGVTAILAIAIVINFLPGTIGVSALPKLGKNDPTLDMSGFRSFAHDFAAGNGNGQFVVISDYWFPAAHFNFYLPKEYTVLAVGPLQHIHHFALINAAANNLQKGDDAFFLTVSNYYKPPSDQLKKSFADVRLQKMIPQWRGGKIARYFYVFALKGYRGGIAADGVEVN
jgi:Dolichyl-phosphate-mannose-protein mannosyltransferase